VLDVVQLQQGVVVQSCFRLRMLRSMLLHPHSPASTHTYAFTVNQQQ
jgi:hypothetical protein